VSALPASPLLPEAIVAALRGALGEGRAALHEPRFAGNEWNYLKECLDTGYVSSVGAFVDRFEADLAAYTGARHAVAVVNGTAALHLALMLAGVQPGDEVLVPALTFVATANAVAYCNATPHFVDSDPATLGMDPARLREYLRTIAVRESDGLRNRRSGRPIRALVPMHTFGHPVDMDALLQLADEFGLAVVEDATESLGSVYHGRQTGTLARIGTLSFNGNKTVTTGGGGAILTDDSALAKRAKHLSTTAKLPHAWEFRHDEVGYNYRMPNINAALGCAQLEQLPAMLASKRALHERYREVFAGVDGVQLFAEPAGCRSNYWLQALLLDPARAHERDDVLAATNAAGYMTRPVWTLMPELRPYAQAPTMELEGARSLARRLVNIPSSAGLVSA
jgi:aminotransferase in exopolysaccharide biosynthesis